MALEIGAAYITIIPSTRGMIKEIKRSLNEDGGKAATQAGRNMGRNLSQGISSGIADVDPLDKLTTSVDKASSSVNEFTKAKRKAGEAAKDADDKARLANLRYGEALRRSNTSQSTLLSLQLAQNKATRDAANAKAGLAIANQSELAQIGELRKRRLELKEATSLLSEAQKSAAMTHQSLQDRFRSRMQGRGSGVNLEVEVAPGSFERLGATIERSTAALRNRYNIEIDVDVDRGVLRNVGNTIRRTFDGSQMGGFGSRLREVSAGFGQIYTKIMHLVPGTWVILGTLGAIAVMTFSPLLASMTQVLGLLAAIPAAAMAAAGAIAAIAVGSMGVFKALGAGFKAKPAGVAGGAGNGRQLERAQKQAARSAADGARQIADAERGLARAQKQSQKAQEDLSEARREAADDIEDLNQQLRDSQLDEEGAVLGVRRAYESLQEVMGSGDSSALDQAEARHNYKESIARLEGVRRENKELAEQVDETNRAGVEGHDKVVSAQERVESAAESVADAQRGVTDAVESAARASEDAADSMADASVAAAGGAAAVDEYAEALANLSPSARKFVETVLSLKDAWGEVRLATQEALFKGMGPAFERFSYTYIPILRNGLSAIAAEFNGGFMRMFDDLERTGVTASWDAIFSNLATATAPFMDALRSISEVFTDIALIGSGYFEEIAIHIRDWADGLRDAVNANPEKIHGWIQNAIDAFGRLKTTTGLVLELIYRIFSPGTETGDKMWDKINATLESWNETLGSAEGQETLRRVFSDAMQAAKDLKEILEGTAKIVRFLSGAVPGEEVGGTSGSDKGGGSDGYGKKEPHWSNPAWLTGKMGMDPEGKGGTAASMVWDTIKRSFDLASEEGPRDENGNLKVVHGAVGVPGPPQGGAKSPQAKPAGGTAPEGTTEWDALSDPQNWADQFAKAGASISETWTNVVTPVKDGWNSGWDTAKTKFGTFKDEASRKWGELSTGVKSWYDTTIQPTLSRFGLDTDSLKNGNGIAANIMKGDWQGLGGNIKDIIDNNIAPAMERMKGFGNSVKDTFHNVVNGIVVKWGELKSGTASVINWIIRTVFNSGLKEAWNAAARFLPITRIENIPEIPGYAVGGKVTGPGTGTSDSITARLSHGEHVLTASEVKAMGGHDRVYAMRKKVRQGIWPTGHGAGNMPKFADGGEVGGSGRLLPSPGEGGLQDIAKLAKRLIHRIWPSISSIGGFRQDAYPEHPSGRALDVMVGVGNPIGDEVTSWALANDAVLPLQHALWKQTVWTPGGGTSPMGDRGDPTQNHMDHPHLWYKPKAIDPNVVPDGLVGHDGLTDKDRMAGIKEKISEILAKIMDPIGETIRGHFAPPPHLDEVPGGFYDKTRTAIEDKTMGIVDNLGDTLKDVYKKAREVKDIIGNFVGAGVGLIPGIKRDTGGVLPMGTSVVTNETGKPEQILNWPQIEAIQQMMRNAITLVRDLGAQHGYSADAELIADAIGDRLDETDWEQVGFRLDAFSVQAEKIGLSAAESYGDDALGVFGVRGGRKRLEEYQAFGRALSGEGAGDVAGVPTPDSVIGGGTGGTSASRTLPTVTQKSVALTTSMPDLDSPSGGPVKDVVKAQFAKHGWDKEPYWSAVDWIVGKESTWNPTISNPSSGAFGLFQFLGGTKDQYLPSMSPDPAIQGAAGAKYIADRYGDPLKAKAFWEQNGWYDNGGVLKPGRTLAQNDSGKNELILNNRAWRDMSTTVTQAARMAELAPSYVPPGTGGGETTINIQAMDVPGAVAAFRREDARKAQMRVGIR